MDIIFPSVCSFVACLAYCVIIQISPKSILPVSIGGAISCVVYLLLSPLNNAIVQSFLAGVCASAYSELMAYRRRVPVTTHLIIAIIPLVPGGRIYEAMEHCIAGEMDLFIRTALITFGIAGAIALSIILTSPVIKIIFRRKTRQPS